MLCCGGLFWSGSASMHAGASNLSAITSDSIKEKEEQIAQKEEEKEALKGGLSNLQEIKKGLEALKADLNNYVQELDNTLAQIEKNIAELNESIRLKEEEIRKAEEELAAALEKEERQKEAMNASVRMIYEMGEVSLLDLLLRARSMGDFLNQADYVEKLVAYDQQIWQEYKQAREYAQLCQEQLNLEKEILDETKAGVEKEQKNLQLLIEQKRDEILKYETDINDELAEIQAQNEEIRILEAAIAEEKKKLLESNKKPLTYDGGMFKFPLASYTRVSDDYGMRMHPTLGVQQFHNGVDFASPKGTAIYAAYDGQVAAATYSATMGNYVFIDHGDGLYTIYMHASALYVKKGDVVAKGDTIAAVGSTGRSTGNHLHFSVRLNGSYVSPWGYLKN